MSCRRPRSLPSSPKLAGQSRTSVRATLVVREDRATRDVLDVRPATEPLFIALLIDTIRPPAGVQPSPLGVPMNATQDYRRGLASFVSTIKGGNPDAQIAILEYAGATVTAIDFTSEAPTLDRFIQRLFPNRQADAVLIEAVVEGARKLGDKPSPRRAIVAVDFNSRDSSAVPAMQQAAEMVNKSGATVWTVSVRNTSASSSHREDVPERGDAVERRHTPDDSRANRPRGDAQERRQQFVVAIHRDVRPTCQRDGEIDADGDGQGWQGAADAVDAMRQSRNEYSPPYLRSARHPITTRTSLGFGAGVRSMKYTCCPSGDTSYCVPQCPAPMSGTLSALATPSVSSPVDWRSTDRPRRRPPRLTKRISRPSRRQTGWLPPSPDTTRRLGWPDIARTETTGRPVSCDT